MEYKEMKFKDAAKYLPTRLVNAINKLIGVKGLVLFATYKLIEDKAIPAEVSHYAWGFVVLIVVFGKDALSVIKDIKK